MKRLLAPFWKHMQSLPRAKLAPLARYADPRTAGYRKLNHTLRTDHAAILKLPELVELDEIIAQSPRLTSPLTVYRGLMDPEYLWWVQSEPNVRVADRGFMSCTLSRTVATMYAVREALTPMDLEGSLILEIKLGFGQQMMCVHCAAGVIDVPEEEMEILLPRNTTLSIEGVRKEGNIHVCTALVIDG